jgi:hypothetical protein
LSDGSVHQSISLCHFAMTAGEQPIAFASNAARVYFDQGTGSRANIYTTANNGAAMNWYMGIAFITETFNPFTQTYASAMALARKDFARARFGCPGSSGSSGRVDSAGLHFERGMGAAYGAPWDLYDGEDVYGILVFTSKQDFTVGVSAQFYSPPAGEVRL